MRRTRTLLIALIALAVTAPPAAAADFWREPDRTINATNGDASGADIVDLGGTPYVAWSEARQARVARLEGGEWKQVGSVLNADPAREAGAPTLTVNEGIVWATWLERDANGSTVVHVARLQGGTWIPIGGPADRFPSVAPGDNRYYAGQGQLVFKDGVPYLGLIEDNGVEFQFMLMRLNAEEKWAVVAGDSIGRGARIDRGFDLEVSGGRLYVSGGNHSGFGVVWRLATNGHEWENVGTPFGADRAGALTDVGGVLHVTYVSQVNGQNSGQRAARLVNGAWENVGPHLVAPGDELSSARSIVDVGGVPHVLMWTGLEREPVFRYDLAVVRLAANGGAWEPVGEGAINNTRQIGAERLAAVGGVPHVAWSEFDGCNFEARVARLESATSDDPALPVPGSCPPRQPDSGGGGGSENGGGNGNGGGGGNPTPVPLPTPEPGVCGVQLLGTQLADALSGDGNRNEIIGLGGNDRIWGGGHADCLSGGVGNDLLDGGAGNDLVHGDAGHDRLKGGADSDELRGGAGNDRLSGDDDEDELGGGAGNDVLSSGDGFDTVSAGSGNDVIDARGSGFDRIDCGPGRDRVKNATRRSDVLRGCEVVSYLRR